MAEVLRREGLFQALLAKDGRGTQEAWEMSQEEQLGYLQRVTYLPLQEVVVISATVRQRMLPLAVWRCLGMEQFAGERQVASGLKMPSYMVTAMTFAEAAMDTPQVVVGLEVERVE